MKTRKINLTFILLFSASFMLPCLAEEKADSLLVKIDVYSGLPNPVFVIKDTAVIARIRDLIKQGTDSLGNKAALVDSNTVKSYYAKSGYRGLRITDIGAEGWKQYIIRGQMLFQVVRAKKSVEGKSRNPLPRAFKDTYGIEKILIDFGLNNQLIDRSVAEEIPARLK
jgi:hypothetical protein